MKHLCTYILLLFLSSLHAQTSIKFNLEEQPITNKHLIFYIDTTDKIDVQFSTNNDNSLIVNTEVFCESGKSAIIDYLKKDGRYNLSIYEHKNFYATVLKLKNNQKNVFMNNNLFKENIIYYVSIPENVTYEIKLPAKVDKPTTSVVASR